MTVLDTIKAFFTTKVVLIIISCVAALGLLLWLISYEQSCSTNRSIEKKKEAVNSALANIANKDAQINEHTGRIEVLKEEQDAEKKNVNALTQDYLQSANVAEQQRIEANKALANLANARDANTTNTSVHDLEEKLKGL